MFCTSAKLKQYPDVQDPYFCVNIFYRLTEMYGTGLTKKQVEDSFDGVICRCTGMGIIYRSRSVTTCI